MHTKCKSSLSIIIVDERMGIKSSLESDKLSTIMQLEKFRLEILVTIHQLHIEGSYRIQIARKTSEHWSEGTVECRSLKTINQNDLDLLVAEIKFATTNMLNAKFASYKILFALMLVRYIFSEF